MKIKNSQYRWIIDVTLFSGFILCFFMDFTGLGTHQWLGAFVGLFVLYHLAIHWDWVMAVTTRFTKRDSTRSRLYLIIDFLLFAGLLALLVTGLGISTWLSLPLSVDQNWVLIHVSASILTLLVALIKIGLHWRWIILTGSKFFTSCSVKTLPAGIQPSTSSRSAISRREFLKVVIPATAVTVIAVGAAIKGLYALGLGSSTTGIALADFNTPITSSTSAATSPTAQTDAVTQSTSRALTTSVPATQTATPVPEITASNACTIRCTRGCSYPGHCRRYIDSNNDNRCDLGECI